LLAYFSSVAIYQCVVCWLSLHACVAHKKNSVFWLAVSVGCRPSFRLHYTIPLCFYSVACGSCYCRNNPLEVTNAAKKEWNQWDIRLAKYGQNNKQTPG
jgi:hypothetical protein